MGEAEIEGAPRVQAMEQNHDDPQRIPPRRLRDPSAPEVPESEDVMRWAAAGIVAGAALLGLLVLVAMIAYVLEPPGWLQMVLGVVMAAGAAFFAWLLASALRGDDGDAGAAPRRR